MDRKHS